MLLYLSPSLPHLLRMVVKAAVEVVTASRSL
jgi:hypothetical protein